MGKIIKLCVVAILFLFVTPWHAYAQSTYPDSIVVNDLLGEARLAEKTKYLMKISLIGNSNDTVHKVIYYLTPNTFDVSINQIKEALSSQNIELDMMNMSDAKVDSEIKEYQTNLGLLSKQLISAPTHAVAGFQNMNVVACLLQAVGSGKAGGAGTDDSHIGGDGTHEIVLSFPSERS